MMHCPKCNCERETCRGACPVCGYKRSKIVVAVIAVTAASLLLATLAVGGVVAMVSRLLSGVQPPVWEAPSKPATQTTQTTQSHTVTITIPEGYSVLKIATALEEGGVCSASEFIQAVQEGDYTDYPFLNDVSTITAEGTPNGRHYRLEGYLYPDTYEFYRNCGGEAAVRRFLDNFAVKYSALQADLTASGLTLDEAVTLASIIQREAKTAEDMYRVSRVLWNRLESTAYPRLQCDATTAYLRELTAAGETPNQAVYDTYICTGLPIGAIANPGWNALAAAVSPSDEDICAGCYFFVYDESGTTYYSRTYAQHLAIWEQIKSKQEG